MSVSTVKKTRIIVIIFYMILFVGLALYDEKPNDEMLRDMTRPLPEVIEPGNACIAFIGFASPKGISPYDYGAGKMRKLKDALLNEKVTGKMTNPFDDKRNELSFVGEIPSFYGSKARKILEYAAEHPHEIAQYSQKNAELLRRYEMLYTYSRHNEPLDYGNYYSLTSFGVILKGQRLKLLQLGVRAKRGDVVGTLAWIRQDIKFWRFIARTSTTFFSKICSFSTLRNDLLFAAELGAYQPLNGKELEMVQEILKPFDHGEAAMTEAFWGEVRWTQTGLELWNPQEKKTFEFDNLLLKQNATKNRMYALYQENIRLAKLAPHEFAIEVKNPQTSKYDSFRRIGIPFLYNPAGEILARISKPLSSLLIVKGHNMEGLRRLAWLKVLARIKKVTPEGMQRFLDDHARDLGNPYTGGPMTWDPQEKSISFKDVFRKKSVEIFL
jgi:hypothetical protein